MLDDGATVKAWDPVGVENYKKHYPTEIQYCDTIESTLQDADICFIFTEWDEVKQMDVKLFETCMERPIVLDGRNCFDLKAFKGVHILYNSIGRPVVDYLYLDDTNN